MSSTQDPYGLRRVVGQDGVLPQAAQTLDPSLPLRDDELLIDVESLNIDAASFRQIEGEAGGDPAKIAARIEAIIRERGKMHNPVTGSGGMLIGQVRAIGAAHPARETLREGDRIATLVSLTLTPLHLEEIVAVHPASDRVDVKGHAILFASGVWAKLPDDLSETLALAALDVCGAPALVERAVGEGDTVMVLGSGKSGLLCCAQAKKKGAKVIALDISKEAVDGSVDMGIADVGIVADAKRPVDVLKKIEEATGGALCDVVVNCASVLGTEMATILSAKDRGKVIFFSTATSFTAAALGAEGVGKDAELLIGNGYAAGHAELTLGLLRENPSLRAHFERRFG